jgi:hypothetical protein
VLNPAWVEKTIRVNSVHPSHSHTQFRQLHHYALLFHDEMVEALADGIGRRADRRHAWPESHSGWGNWAAGGLRARSADLRGHVVGSIAGATHV